MADIHVLRPKTERDKEDEALERLFQDASIAANSAEEFLRMRGYFDDPESNEDVATLVDLIYTLCKGVLLKHNVDEITPEVEAFVGLSGLFKSAFLDGMDYDGETNDDETPGPQKAG